MINSCALCGLCETLCPNDFSMADLCRAAREELVERGLMPPSAHEFALLDMEQRTARGPRASVRAARQRRPFSFRDASSRAPCQNKPRHLSPFWTNVFPEPLECSWVLRRSGLVGRAKGHAPEGSRHSAGNPGFPRKSPLILACSSCSDVFRRLLPETSLLSLWEVLREKGLPPGHPLPDPLALHDPCTTRSLPAWRNAVRDILRALGQPFEELSMTGETTRCCGYGGLQSLVDPDLAEKGVRRRLGESDKDFLAYCAMCRESLSDSGKPVAHLLDLFFPPAAPYEAVGFPRDRPTGTVATTTSRNLRSPAGPLGRCGSHRVSRRTTVP
jgi:Fe-S oxidoreductase